jgi:single stranded DNA-binding protein
MNTCTFIGRFTNDPELKSVKTADGDINTNVVNFRLAITRKFKKGNGELGKQTNFLDFEAWDSGAEVIVKNFRKGDPIIIHASARSDVYEFTNQDNETKRINTVRFRVEKFEFVPSKIDHEEE